MSKKDIISILKDLNIPSDKYIVTMGASLAAHNLRLAGDIDIIFDPSVTDILKEKGFKYEPKSREKKYKNRYTKGSIEAFDNFYNIGTFSECVQKYSPVIINGVPFMSLADTFKVKSLFGRLKDVNDLALA